ncbi:MAG: long-chain fatty acid--CoA ligase [Acidobacteriota bacterium]|jgi:fatty-acyl-CoA synthase
MRGLMMDFELTVPAILDRAAELFPQREIVSRRPDRSLHRYTYADMHRRTRQLAAALQRLGVGKGDRVATLAWNHYQHQEAYFGVPACGGVLHTLNLRLAADDIAYIVNHAGDKVILVDEVLLPLFDQFRDQVDPEHVVVMRQRPAGDESGGAPEPDDAPDPDTGYLDYEALLAAASETSVIDPELDEHDAAAMCYTSGTTGRPKGVLYSHRALFLHSLVSLTALDVREDDVMLPVVPMFHANAWGTPFTFTMVGAKQIHPGKYLDPPSLLELFQSERVTFTAGVPTIWLGILQILDADPDAYDLSSLRTLAVGGAAAPQSMIEGFEKRHGLSVLHAWGMTETAPIGTVCDLSPERAAAAEQERYATRAMQGRPVPLVEIRARGETGLVPWDGASMGELEVRGPWVASAYYQPDEPIETFTDDGWFRTGDIVTIDPDGYVQIQDRAKDLIKSGGEWISSIALESALMSHPAVAEAAVIAVAHPKWQERPLSVVALKAGRAVTAGELIDHLRPHFSKICLPSAIEFVDEIPKTSAGKFQKLALRERYADYVWPDEAG